MHHSEFKHCQVIMLPAVATFVLIQNLSVNNTRV